MENLQKEIREIEEVCGGGTLDIQKSTIEIYKDNKGKIVEIHSDHLI